MSREVPFNDTEPCDHCGAPGAWDFMGDYCCSVCIAAFQAHDVSESTDRSSINVPNQENQPS